jgi:hypothetical protein
VREPWAAVRAGIAFGLPALPRASGFAQSDHRRRRAATAALRTLDPHHGKFDQGKIAVLPDELLGRQRAAMAAGRAYRQPDPAVRGIPQADEPRLSVGVLSAHG